MFCTTCGKTIGSGENFCSNCGRAVVSAVAVPSGSTQLATPSAISPGALLVLFTGVLCVIAIATLHAKTAGLAVLCIIALPFAVFSKRINKRTKLWVLAAAVLVIFILNGIEGWHERRESQREARIAEQQAANKAAQQKRNDEKFNAMSPKQHLERARSLLNVNATSASIAEASQHLAALPPQSHEAVEGLRLKRAYDNAKDQQARAAEQKKAAERAAADRILRDALAKTLEEKLLDAGYNAVVRATGKDHKTLYIEWILTDRVLVHQMSKENNIFEGARAVGFDRIEISDGYDNSWHWKLN